MNSFSTIHDLIGTGIRRIRRVEGPGARHNRDDTTDTVSSSSSGQSIGSPNRAAISPPKSTKKFNLMRAVTVKGFKKRTTSAYSSLSLLLLAPLAVAAGYQFIVKHIDDFLSFKYRRCHFTAFGSDIIDIIDGIDSSSGDTCATEQRFWSLLLKPFNSTITDTDPSAMKPPSDFKKQDIEVGLQRITKELIARNIAANDGSFHTKVYQVMSDLNQTLCQKSFAAGGKGNSPPRVLLEIFREACSESCEYCQAARLDKMVQCLRIKNARLCRPVDRRLSEAEAERTEYANSSSTINTENSDQARPFSRSDREEAVRRDRLAMMEEQQVSLVPGSVDTATWDYQGKLFFDYCPTLFYHSDDSTIHPLWRALGLPPGTYLAVMILAMDAMERHYLPTLARQPVRATEKSGHLLLRMLSHQSMPKTRHEWTRQSPTWLTSPLTVPEYTFDAVDDPSNGANSFHHLCTHWTGVLEWILTESQTNPKVREAVAGTLVAHGHSKWLLTGLAEKVEYKYRHDRLKLLKKGNPGYHHKVQVDDRFDEAELSQLSSWINNATLARSFEFYWYKDPRSPVGGRWEHQIDGIEKLVLDFPKVEGSLTAQN